MDRHIVITPTKPAGAPVTFNLIDDATLSRSGSTGGGWQIVDRPRRGATTEWLDHSPFQLQLSLLLDGISDQPFNQPVSVEPACLRTESWEVRAPGQIWPAVLKVTGPVPHNELPWVVQSLSWDAAIRDPQSGQRWQQALSMTLLQYAPAVIVTPDTSPAASAQRRADSSPGSTSSLMRYTAVDGDTLPLISVKLYGDFRQWQTIGQLNGITDPNAVTPGQVLLVPATAAA